jgi:hypothetical protein
MGVHERVASARKLVANRPGRPVTLLLVAVFLASGLTGLLWYSTGNEVSVGALASVELSGSDDAARQAICSGPLPRAIRVTGVDHCRPESVASLQHDLRREWWLLLSATVGLLGLNGIGALLLSSARALTLTRVATVLTIVFALLSTLSIRLLGTGLTALSEGRSADALWVILGASSAVRFVVLIFVTLAAGVTALIVVFRGLMPAADFSGLRKSVDGRTQVEPPPTVIDAAGEPFPNPWARPVTMSRLGRESGQLGICVSGGGIRAATVTLGALQSLRRHGILARARYLVSVSGGGYMAGAFQLAQQPLPESDAPGRPAAEVFEPGSPEESHVRRHGMYIADSRREWILALGSVLRGALASLLVLAGLVAAVGLTFALLYHLVPIASFGYDLPFSAPAGAQAPPLPDIPGAVRWGLGLSVGLGVASWMLLVVVVAAPKWLRLVVKPLSDGLLMVAAAMLLLGVVVPFVVWAGTRMLWWLDDTARLSASTVAVSGAAGTVTVAYLGSLLSILWRSRKKIGEVRKMFGAKSQLQQRVPTSWSQRIVVWLVLLVLAAAYAVLFGVVVHTATRPAFFTLDVGRWGPQWTLGSACLGLLVVALFVDQTWMSLQPFYRRRLASAFAVRRVIGQDQFGRPVAAARAYDWSNENTMLSRYGRRPETADFPQVIFSAAANLSGSNRTPPGRHAVSFSLSHDWIGGPQVGYIRADALEELLGGRWRNLSLDLTVQNAVAVSGAAFASAMGSKSTAFQILFALSNARLGTWLPNPGWLWARTVAQKRNDWLGPRLPRIRRLTYFLREVAGVYDDRDRFLLVTDGGHYDNLGLVELLRHRCATVICIDSSGDAPPLAGALSEAITLAREELDVVVTLDHPRALVPGGGPPLDPASPLATLNARLSEACVVTGTVSYPAQGPEAAFDGRIVIVKTTLTGQLPYELLTYAVSNPVFPHDSTGDQWFDHGQFNAYHALGRHLGDAAAAAIDPTLPAAVPNEARV